MARMVTMRSLCLAATLAFAGGLQGQTASFIYIDQKSPYSNPSPAWLVALNTPRLGTRFQLAALQGRTTLGCNLFCQCPYSMALILGASNPALNSSVFSGRFQFRGFLYSNPIAILPLQSKGGYTIVSLQIPSSPAFRGTTFYLQSMQIEVRTTTPTCIGANRVGLSRGLRCVAGL